MMKHRKFDVTRRRRVSGFSLIEVLVALLVLAIGLLGLAALQAQGLRFNHDAYVRTTATHMASGIIDRMRVNRNNVAPYTAAPAPPFNCDPTVSSIAMDLECWYDGLSRSLPGGAGVITANATANFYDVTVRWVDRTPRNFGGMLRVAASAADCAAIAGRFWDGANCLVQQTWTVWP
jgi:type IV pilus assembly protein PilV